MANRSTNRPLLSLLLALGAATACSVESDGPPSGGARAGTGGAGTGGAPSNPPGSTSGDLVIVGDPMVRLGFGATAQLTVQVLNDDEEPERNETVAFDLIGRPEDSSLSSLVDRTDSEGTARVMLRAATRPATFEVRASVGGERSKSFSVSVSGAGFGTLVVRAPYQGARAVSERFVIALPNASCPAEHSPGDPRTVIAPGEDSATLIALPAAVPYAVLAVAESSSGVVVAQGCVDQRCVLEVCDPVSPRAQARDELTVPFTDLPLTPAAELRLEVTVEAGSGAAALGSAIRSAINTVVRTNAAGQNVLADAEGRFWLDSLDAALRDEDEDAESALADALESARLHTGGNGPDSSLAALLHVNDEGAQLAASAIAGRVRDALDTFTLRADLEYGRRGAVAVRPVEIEALPVAAGEPAPRVTLGETEATVGEASLSDAQDTLELSMVRLSPRLGALAADALDRVLSSDDPALGDTLMGLSGCNSLAEWLSEQSYFDASACAEGCVERACERSMARMLEAAYAALRAVDEQRPHATLMGSLLLTDDDGDLRAEQMTAETMDGLWEPAPNASLGDTLRGTAVARLPD